MNKQVLCFCCTFYVHLANILNLIYLIWRSDISNRARVLLARLSKSLARSQALKKPNGMKSSSNAQQELMLKQRQVHIFIAHLMGFLDWILTHHSIICSIDDVVGYEPWESNIDFTVSASYKINKRVA